jgi:hypothetical protein
MQISRFEDNKKCRFETCGLLHLGNLRIGDSGINLRISGVWRAHP